MKLIKADTNQQYRRIKNVYQSSFPKYEKKPFWLIKQKQKQGLVDIWELSDGGEFIGLAIIMKAKDLVLLDYFAIAEDKRASGYGSKALSCLQEYYKKNRFFLEIESTHGKAENQKQREQRKSFYLSNQMTEIGIIVDVFGTEMEVLGYECSLDFGEYKSVYEVVYGKGKSEKLRLISE